MTARSPWWDVLVTAGAAMVLLLPLGLREALAMIGTVDGKEARPVLAAMSWLRHTGRHIRAQIARALEDDGKEAGSELGDSDQPPRRVGGHSGAWPVPERDGSAGSDAGAAGAEADRAGGRRLAGASDVHPAAAPGDEDDDLITGGDYDTDTLAIFAAVNQEHLVRPHEPQDSPASWGAGEGPGRGGQTASVSSAAAAEPSGPGRLRGPDDPAPVPGGAPTGPGGPALRRARTRYDNPPGTGPGDLAALIAAYRTASDTMLPLAEYRLAEHMRRAMAAHQAVTP